MVTTLLCQAVTSEMEARCEKLSMEDAMKDVHCKGMLNLSVTTPAATRLSMHDLSSDPRWISLLGASVSRVYA